MVVGDDPPFLWPVNCEKPFETHIEVYFVRQCLRILKTDFRL